MTNSETGITREQEVRTNSETGRDGSRGRPFSPNSETGINPRVGIIRQQWNGKRACSREQTSRRALCTSLLSLISLKPEGLFAQSSLLPPKPEGLFAQSSLSLPKPEGLFAQSSLSLLKPEGLFAQSSLSPKVHPGRHTGRYTPPRVHPGRHTGRYTPLGYTQGGIQGGIHHLRYTQGGYREAYTPYVTPREATGRHIPHPEVYTTVIHPGYTHSTPWGTPLVHPEVHP